MSGFPTTETAPVGTSPVQTGSKDTLTLLEEFASLNFMLHTHHPMTHVPVVDTASTQGSINVRMECAEGRIPVTSIA